MARHLGGHQEGLDRLPGGLPRARLVDFEIAAVDIFGC
jgi:hypothetical protein